MEELIGNVLVAQSGGPTTVINASLAGVITEALNHECIEEIYGGLNGIEGILNERLIDLAAESQQAVRGLSYTPASALGTCRYKIKSDADYARFLDVCKAHNIRYFFYIGGNDSQDTANKIAQYAKSIDWQMRVIGIPKTIDNDLVMTDHCPGYGSVVKYLATTIRELALDHEAMGNHDLVSIVEVMGRNAGWIAAGTTIAKRKNMLDDPPHIILLPEVAFNADYFISQVEECLKKNKYCLVVASEGLADENGNYVAAGGATDSFGHSQLGGVGEALQNLVASRLSGVKARSCKIGHAQRAASHCSSATDSDEAFKCGQEAVKAAVEGQTGKMVAIVRGDGDKYKAETTLVDLNDVANGVKHFPENWINEDKVSISQQFNKYILPLMQGEVKVPFENGLPAYVRLAKNEVEKKLS
ncbi:MAG: 6-phosphofructokinase [Verrucomicrobiaceae bacterium]|nr:6-phosphofructokinase [Verrucomicrobiaceae bacterium]